MIESTPLFTQAQFVVETIGIIAFALAGIVQAARQKLDAIGVCAVAGLTAFGGGTLRDLLLDRRPFFWVEHTELLWLIFGLA
ncbi:MAG: trimeric intracellular cation channel family protein, partial [Litorivicinaceae bacterium]